MEVASPIPQSKPLTPRCGDEAVFPQQETGKDGDESDIQTPRRDDYARDSAAEEAKP